MRRHFELMIEANRVMNLTRITDPADAAVKHYADSLALVAWARARAFSIRSLLDIGTGAGFPAVPIAVMCPEWEVTAIDGTAKKIEFLKRVRDELGLANLRLEHGHSSHWRSAYLFDVVTTRAVAMTPSFLAQIATFVAPEGRFISYFAAPKGGKELVASADVPSSLSLEEVWPYELSVTLQRCLLGMKHKQQ